MTLPPIRTFADVTRALQFLYQEVFQRDTIVRAGTLAPTLFRMARAGPGEVVVNGGGSATLGSVNREPSANVSIASGYALLTSHTYTIAAGNTLTIAAGGELRVL